jgi:hypothetical protein
MAHRTTLALVVSLALACAGCGTLENVKRPCFPPPDAPTASLCKVYGGVRGDWDIIMDYPWERTDSFLDYVTVPPLAAFDLFFALVGDTITLPYTGYEEVRRAYYGPSGPPGRDSNFVPVVVSETASPAPQPAATVQTPAGPPGLPDYAGK